MFWLAVGKDDGHGEHTTSSGPVPCAGLTSGVSEHFMSLLRFTKIFTLPYLLKEKFSP